MTAIATTIFDATATLTLVTVVVVFLAEGAIRFVTVRNDGLTVIRSSRIAFFEGDRVPIGVITLCALLPAAVTTILAVLIATTNLIIELTIDVVGPSFAVSAEAA